MTRILVIQNNEAEGLGSFESELKQAGVEFDLIKAYEAQSLPAGVMLDEVGYRGIMILGGPMSALDDHGHPFLLEEVRLIHDALERKLPLLNVCLGAQLLARACHMPLKIGGQKEVGWHEVQLNTWFTQRNPLFFQVPEKFMTFHWHSDTFEIPAEGYRLAGSKLYPNQAFCFGGNAYGIQFHPEITEELIHAWIAADEKRSKRFISAEQEAAILAGMPQFLADQQKIAHQIIYGWTSLLRPKDYRRPIVEEIPEEKPVEVAAEATPETSAEEAVGE